MPTAASAASNTTHADHQLLRDALFTAALTPSCMPPLQTGVAVMTLEDLRVLKADQKAKLLCFCTGPAIYHPSLNWLCEFMSSIIFVSA